MHVEGRGTRRAMSGTRRDEEGAPGTREGGETVMSNDAHPLLAMIAGKMPASFIKH